MVDINVLKDEISKIQLLQRCLCISSLSHMEILREQTKDLNLSISGYDIRTYMKHW